MKKLILNFLVLLFLFVLFFGCAQNKKNTDKEADIKAIKEVLNQYRQGGNTGDLDLFISAWADDAIRMEPDYHAIIGKEKIRAHFKKAFDKWYCNIELYGEIEVEACDNLGFSRVNYILSLTPKEGGETTHFDGKVVDVYKKQADGSWKIYIDCLNNNPMLSEENISPELQKDQDQSDPVF